MQQRRVFLVLGILVWIYGCATLAEVREVKSLHEVAAAIDSDTLLVFDIDNTLIEPVGQLGSDQWFYYLYQIYKIEGVGEKEIESRAMRVWNETQALIQVQAPEGKFTAEFVKKQQTRGIKTMAMTARTLDIAEKTAQQLHSVGIDLSQNTVLKTDLLIEKKALESEDDAKYTKGILFVGESNNKGKVLAHFLRINKLSPKKIVFVDDKVKHVNNVGIALQELKIPYFGFRYGAVDDKVKQFNQVMADVVDKPTAELYLHGRLNNEKSKGNKR